VELLVYTGANIQYSWYWPNFRRHCCHQRAYFKAWRSEIRAWKFGNPCL